MLSEDIDSFGLIGGLNEEVVSTLFEDGFRPKLTIINSKSDMNLFKTQIETRQENKGGLFLTNNEKMNPNAGSHSTLHFKNSNNKRNSVKLNSSSSLYYEDSTIYKPVDINLPKKYTKKILPIKMTSMAKTLNEHLSRLDGKYAKDEITKRHRDNPKTNFYFDSSQYYAYRVSKVTDNKDVIKPKLQPLIIQKEKGIERLANSIFNCRTVLLKNINKVFTNREEL